MSLSDIFARLEKKLISIGAELILIPCNTSHYFYDEIQSALEVPVVNMIAETAIWCASNGYKKVGVLATDGTKEAGIFEKELKKYKVEVIYPSQEGQKEVMSVIYNQVKAGRSIDTSALSKHLLPMVEDGAQAFILGCTELPIALKDGDYGLKFIDTLEILSRAGIEKSGYKTK